MYSGPNEIVLKTACDSSGQLGDSFVFANFLITRSAGDTKCRPQLTNNNSNNIMLVVTFRVVMLLQHLVTNHYTSIIIHYCLGKHGDAHSSHL